MSKITITIELTPDSPMYWDWSDAEVVGYYSDDPCNLIGDTEWKIVRPKIEETKP